MANSLEAWAKENPPKRALSTINEDPAEEDAAGWNKEAALGNDAERSKIAEALGALDPFRGLDSPNMDWKEAKRVLTDFERLEAMDAPPNTRPFNPASFKNSDEYQDAFDAQVKAICNYLPPVSSKSVRNLPPPNHLAHLRGLMLWWAPRLLQVIQIGGAAKEEFWTKFNEVMDLWKGVPFFDDKCVQFPSDARRDYLARYLCTAAFDGQDRTLHLDQSADWKMDFDLDFHRRFLHQALSRANRPGEEDYYRANRSSAAANHLIDKAAHPEKHCECLLTTTFHGVLCFARCSCYSFF